jgi:hypothetical protein
MTPLIARMLKHAFLSGVVAAKNLPAHEPYNGNELWEDYDPMDEELKQLHAVIDEHDKNMKLAFVDGFNSVESRSLHENTVESAWKDSETKYRQKDPLNE